MIEQQVKHWLDAYGAAWVAGDPDALVKLFSPSAIYRETPFDPVLTGSDEIRAYWQDGAQDAQKDVRFDCQLWTFDQNVAVAGWQAQFTRIPSGVKVALDGVFKLEFETHENGILCIKLEEWWHRQES